MRLLPNTENLLTGLVEIIYSTDAIDAAKFGADVYAACMDEGDL